MFSSDGGNSTEQVQLENAGTKPHEQRKGVSAERTPCRKREKSYEEHKESREIRKKCNLRSRIRKRNQTSIHAEYTR